MDIKSAMEKIIIHNYKNCCPSTIGLIDSPSDESVCDDKKDKDCLACWRKATGNVDSALFSFEQTLGAAKAFAVSIWAHKKITGNILMDSACEEFKGRKSAK